MHRAVTWEPRTGLLPDETSPEDARCQPGQLNQEAEPGLSQGRQDQEPLECVHRGGQPPLLHLTGPIALPHLHPVPALPQQPGGE